MRIHARLAVLTLLGAAACSDASSSNADGTADGDGGTPEGTGGDDGATSADAGTSTPADAGGSTGGEVTDVPARNISISRVEANPGVAIAVADGGAWVDGGHRNAPIPKNRDTAFRVYVDIVEDGWVARDITARLTVSHADGTSSVIEETAEIGTDSSTTSLQSNILLGVLAEDITSDAKFQVELFEGGTGWESLPAVDTPPVAVADGPALIGVEGSDQHMRVVMVPVAYDYGGCQTLTDLDDAELKPYADAMFQQNPLQQIDISLRDPISVNDLDLTNSNDFFSLLDRAVNLRAQDGPDPNVYYYVLFDNCGQCIDAGGGCLLGVAPGTPGASESEAVQRVAIGTRYLSGQEMGIETFVHEIGHTQGRQHVACPGAAAAGPDVTYPYAGGSIGVWGFGVRDFQIRNPNTHTDYMSYCEPTWVSDWQWSATFARIKALTAWESADVAPRPSGHMLVGNLDPESGRASWWVERGQVDAADVAGSASELAVLSGGAPIHVDAADVDAWSEGSWVTVRANLPAAVLEQADDLELRLPGSTHRITRDAIRRDFAASMRR